jgi:nucleoside 2-deoxyribosyltransferase
VKLYVAGSWLRRKELLKKAKLLEAAGFIVTSRWLTTHDGSDPKYLAACAREDLEDIDKADGILLFTQTKEDGYTTGGRFVELGYAYAKGKAIAIVGPRENVFCHLDIEQFDTFEEALKAFDAVIV